MLNKKPVLDYGYIALVTTWGSDEEIIEAARMSTGKGFKSWGTPEAPGDERLLSYLYKHKHMTPFEMCGMTLEAKCPIFVFREWHRHRTQSFNEMSARYIPLPDENYLPTIDRCMVKKNDSKNKQSDGFGENVLTERQTKTWLLELSELYKHAQHVYEHGLDCGIPKELARLSVPVARYSRMRATANLRNWLQFLTLRMNINAQWEIRMYANAVGDLIRQCFPRTWELFVSDGIVNHEKQS